MDQKLIERCFVLEEEEERRHIQHTDVSIVFGMRMLALVTQSIVTLKTNNYNRG